MLFDKCIPLTDYLYNLQGKLAQATIDPDGPAPGSQPAVETFYGYDAAGNRIYQKTNGVTTLYLVDSQNPTGYAQILEEGIDADGDNTLDPGEVTRGYTLGLDVISQTTLDVGPGTADTLFLAYDAHGSVRMLLNSLGQLARSAAPDNVAQLLSYDAYGNLLNQPWAGGATAAMLNTAFLSTLRYSGEVTDANTQLQYLRARMYDPRSGVFHSMDPWAGDISNPMTLNKKNYSHNNPIYYNDPTGKFALVSTLMTFSAGALVESALLIPVGNGWKTALAFQNEIGSKYGLSSKLSLAGGIDYRGVLIDKLLDYVFGGTNYRWSCYLPLPSPVPGMIWMFSAGMEITGRWGWESSDIKGMVRFSGSIGLFAVGTVLSGSQPPPGNFLPWRNLSKDKLSKFVETGNLRQLSKAFRIPFTKGVSGGPDESGVSFEISGVASLSLSTWGFGVRSSWNVFTGETRMDIGTGIGFGIGVAFEGAIVIALP